MVRFTGSLNLTQTKTSLTTSTLTEAETHHPSLPDESFQSSLKETNHLACSKASVQSDYNLFSSNTALAACVCVYIYSLPGVRGSWGSKGDETPDRHKHLRLFIAASLMSHVSSAGVSGECRQRRSGADWIFTLSIKRRGCQLFRWLVEIEWKK